MANENDEQTNQTETSELSKEVIDYMTNFETRRKKDLTQGFVVRVKSIELDSGVITAMTPEKRASYSVSSILGPPINYEEDAWHHKRAESISALYSAVEGKATVGEKDVNISSEDMKEIIKIASKKCKTSGLFNKKISSVENMNDYEYEHNGYEISAYCSDVSDYLLKDNKAVPKHIYIKSKSRAEEELKNRMNHIKDSMQSLEGRIFENISDITDKTDSSIIGAINSELKNRQDELLWCKPKMTSFSCRTAYDNATNNSDGYSVNTLICINGFIPIGNISCELILPDGTELTKEKWLEYYEPIIEKKLIEHIDTVQKRLDYMKKQYPVKCRQEKEEFLKSGDIFSTYSPKVDLNQI